MTCNQMILLLQIYRGTLGGEMLMGTYEKDALYLTDRGLIQPGTYKCWVTTTKADIFIRGAVLEC